MSLRSLTIGEIDCDGAVRETAAALPTRAQFLRRGARFAGSGTVALGLLTGTARAGVAKSDAAILNFALALEYLQASFYTEAERVGALRGALAEQARVVGSHERAHVAAFRAVLGHAAIKEPHFDFHGVTDSAKSFRATAVAFEDLAVGAYKEQLPSIRSDQYLAAAVSIHSVEARHAAWIRRLAGVVPASKAFDEPLSDRQTVQIVNSTRFVTLHVPQTSADRSPSFTG
jgi:hypothetical protein